MIRSLFSLCLILTLVLTNATGYHCHGDECASTASAVPPVPAVIDEHDHDHHHSNSNEDSASHSPDSGGDRNPSQSDITDSHSHAFSPVLSKPATLTFTRISATVDKKEDAFIVSDSIKPLLEPPSHG